MVFSPENRTIAGIGNYGSKLWDVKTGKLQQKINGRLVISSDWSLYASTEKDKILLWDMNTGKQVKTFTDYKNGSKSLVFSPDGTKLANEIGNLGHKHRKTHRNP